MKCPRCDHSVSKADRFCGRCGLGLPQDGGKPVDPLLGLVVDNRYRIEQRIGVGGMGTVYLGQHLSLGHKVAIKVLHERHVSKPDLVQRFHVEARIYARVDHPNVVKLMHFDQMPDGTTYMVMEYCPGTSLASKLHTGGPLDPALAADLTIQIAQGLSATHQSGVIHRDLKPDNIVLTETRPGRYHVKLLDFGIARDLDDEGPRLTQAGMVFGTPEYMSPEQARGQAVDERSDIYALGCVLYEMLTGRPPFTGKDKLRVMHQQAVDLPPPPSSHLSPGSLPPALEDICLICLAKQPDDRYASADVLIEAFDELSLLADRASPAPGGAGAAGTPAAAPTPAAATSAVGETRPELPARGSGPVTLQASPPTPTGPQGLSGLAQARERPGPRAGTGRSGPREWGPPSGARPLPAEGPLFIDPGLPPGLGGDDGMSSASLILAVVFMGAVGLAAWLFAAPKGDPDPPKTRSEVVASPASRTPSAAPTAPPRLDAQPIPARPASRAPVTEAPRVPTIAPPRVPATAATRAPATEAPRAPATRAPAPRIPATEAPRAPATVASRAPRSAPRRPATEAPKAPATEAPPSAAEQVSRGQAALRAGRFDDAARSARAALELEPSHEAAQALQADAARLSAALREGVAAKKRHDCVKVIEVLEAVVAAAPEHAEAARIYQSCQQMLPPKGM